MEHIKLLIIKFLATFVLIYLVLNIGYGISLGRILMISFLSIVTYFLVDLLVLKRTNNFITTLTDFSFYFTAIFFGLNQIGFAGDQLMAAFITSVVLSVYELFFHIYVGEELNYTQEKTPVHRYDYMTEFTREFDPFIDDYDDEDDYY